MTVKTRRFLEDMASVSQVHQEYKNVP